MFYPEHPFRLQYLENATKQRNIMDAQRIFNNFFEKI